VCLKSWKRKSSIPARCFAFSLARDRLPGEKAKEICRTHAKNAQQDCSNGVCKVAR